MHNYFLSVSDWLSHEVLSKFQEYEIMVTNLTGLKIQTLRSDNGGEYTSKEFAKFCASKGIVHQFTNLYTPEQNGVSERLNQTLIESRKSMLFHAGLPLRFWAEAVNTATYLHRSPVSSLPDKDTLMNAGTEENLMYLT